MPKLRHVAGHRDRIEGRRRPSDGNFRQRRVAHAPLSPHTAGGGTGWRWAMAKALECGTVPAAPDMRGERKAMVARLRPLPDDSARMRAGHGDRDLSGRMDVSRQGYGKHASGLQSLRTPVGNSGTGTRCTRRSPAGGKRSRWCAVDTAWSALRSSARPRARPTSIRRRATRTSWCSMIPRALLRSQGQPCRRPGPTGGSSRAPAGEQVPPGQHQRVPGARI